jgi:uncharacterized protein
MKKIIVILCTLLLAVPMAEARGYRTSDIENVQRSHREHFTTNPDAILSAEAVRELDAIALSLRERGIAEVAIVAVKSIEPDDPFSFAIKLFEDWGVGNKEADNGLGILLVEDMHEIRFVTGYGIEHVLSDARCVQLQREYMLPYFRDGNYDRGMVEGLKAVDTLLSSGELERVTNTEEEEREAMITALIVVILLIILPLVMLLIAVRKASKCPNCGKHGLKVVERSKVHNTHSPHITTIVEVLECQYCHSRHRCTREEVNHRGGGGGPIIFGGMGGGRGFGGGSFGGGFGGGSFGGGGGGSRW